VVAKATSATFYSVSWRFLFIPNLIFMKIHQLLFGLLLLAPRVLWAQPKEKIVVTDLARIKQVGTVAVSPTGKYAVYELTTTEPVPQVPHEYEYRTQLYLVDLQTKTAPRPLTQGAESSGQPAWSPDGNQLVFVRKVKEKPQLFLLPMAGGEARQLTSLEYGAGGPKWSPDGQRILFSTSVSLAELMKDSLLNPRQSLPVWSLEKPGFSDNSFLSKSKEVKPNPDGTLAEIRAYLQKDEEDRKAKVINRLNFQGESTTEPELRFAQLYTVEVKEGGSPRPVTRGYYSFTQPAWAPDGSILAVTQSDSLQHPDRSLRNRIVRISREGGSWSTVLQDAIYSYSQPTLAPDGRTLAFVRSQAGVLDQGRPGVVVLGTPAQPQVLDFDRSPGTFTWTADSRYLYFTAPANGGVPLYRMEVATRKVSPLTSLSAGVGSFDVARTGIVYAKTEVANPSELFLADLSMKQETRLSRHNDEWLLSKKLSYPTRHTLTNSRGQEIEYWIVKPTFMEAGKKYPLLLEMHGGPTAMWGPGEASMWHEFQFFASQGYGIVYANPRGSGGYGVDFMKANYQDWGTGPAEDVLAAATAAAREAWVDTSRQVITGGSYAGYLTAWIVAHDNRFKAAFAQRGVYDLTTFMGEGNAWRLVPNYFGGYPWEPAVRRVLDANSPQTFVTQIRTPLLIKHGENDLRTGVIQSELLYKSLKVLGKDVEYVRMPGATHELSRTGNPRQRIDRILRIYEFFERYVGER
jgi:dipeptidyl aminopeptidase/acylaminoacyl peptidase